MDMSYSDMNKRYKADVIRNYEDLINNIDTGQILPCLASCLHQSDLEELRKKLILKSTWEVNQILFEKLYTREYWWKFLKKGLLKIKSENLVKDLGWSINEIETVADVSHESQRVKTTIKEEPTTSKPVVTGLDNNGRSALCEILDVMDKKVNAYKNQSNLVKEASLQTNMKVVPNDLNVGVKDTLVVTDTKNFKEFSEAYKPPEQIISDQILTDNNPPVGAQSDVQECSFSETITKVTDDRYNIVPGINSQEPGSISTDEIPSLDGNIFDDDNSISSTATVDPQVHSADGGMKSEICIASNKTNVTTAPRFETKYSMVSPYVTTLHGSYTDSESVDSQDSRSGSSEQQLLQPQVLCHGNMSASLSGVFPPEGSRQLDIPALSIFQESSPAASRPLSQEVPLESPTERLEDQIDFNSSGDRTENMQDLMRHVDDPILELNGQQAQNRESNLPSLTKHAILTVLQAVYSLTR